MKNLLILLSVFLLGCSAKPSNNIVSEVRVIFDDNSQDSITIIHSGALTLCNCNCSNCDHGDLVDADNTVFARGVKYFTIITNEK